MDGSSRCQSFSEEHCNEEQLERFFSPGSIEDVSINRCATPIVACIPSPLEQPKHMLTQLSIFVKSLVIFFCFFICYSQHVLPRCLFECFLHTLRSFSIAIKKRFCQQQYETLHSTHTCTSNNTGSKSHLRKSRRPKKKRKSKPMINKAKKAHKPYKRGTLLSLAYTKNLQELAKLAPFYKEELEEEHAEHKCLPLHIACRFWDSIDIYVLRTLLESAPRTARHVDNEGSTPLHFLLHYGSPKPDVLKLLIEAYPEATKVRDVYGRTPLFHAVENDLSLKKLKIILAADDSKSSILQCCGPVPQLYKDPMNSRGTHDSRQKVRELPPSALQRSALYISWKNALDPRDCGEPLKSYRAKGKMWEKAMFLLRLAYEDKYPGSKFRLLHATLAFYSCLPTSVVDFVFALSHAKEREEGTGRFPLHIAASIDAPDCEVACIVDTLLRIHPEAAFLCGHNGRYPLQEAIVSGKSWESATFQLLLKSNPSVIHTIDAATGLYPFMLAAVSVVASVPSGKMHMENHIGFAEGSEENAKEEICQHCNKIVPEEDMSAKEVELQTFNSAVNPNANGVGIIYELLLADPAIFLSVP